MLTLHADVLHISKISGNLVQLVAAEWEPIACLKNTLKMFNLEVSAKSIDLKLECDPSMTMLGTTVIGDEGRFTQVGHSGPIPARETLT